MTIFTEIYYSIFMCLLNYAHTFANVRTLSMFLKKTIVSFALKKYELLNNIIFQMK